MTYSLAGKRVWVAGHQGMVGRALMRRLSHERCQILTVPRDALDLRDSSLVQAWMQAERPQAIILAAAKVGGILANAQRPAEFLYDNLMIAANVIDAAHKTNVERLLVLGSSAAYPREAAQPMPESALLTGPLEPTHEAYAIAKIAAIKLVQAYRAQFGRDYIAALPTNLYGPGDRFDLEAGHVVASLIRKTADAVSSHQPELVMWGSGSARREFLHVDDCADACVFLINNYSSDAPINVGSGEEVAIRDLLKLIAGIAGFHGKITPDTTKPEGPPRKLMDSSRLAALGWRPSIALRDGLSSTFQWYQSNV